jgi:hypothetical protein
MYGFEGHLHSNRPLPDKTAGYAQRLVDSSFLFSRRGGEQKVYSPTAIRIRTTIP